MLVLGNYGLPGLAWCFIHLIWCWHAYLPFGRSVFPLLAPHCSGFSTWVFAPVYLEGLQDIFSFLEVQHWTWKNVWCSMLLISSRKALEGTCLTILEFEAWQHSTSSVHEHYYWMCHWGQCLWRLWCQSSCSTLFQRLNTQKPSSSVSLSLAFSSLSFSGQVECPTVEWLSPPPLNSPICSIQNPLERKPTPVERFGPSTPRFFHFSPQSPLFSKVFRQSGRKEYGVYSVTAWHYT